MNSRFLVSSDKTAKVLFYQKKNQGWSFLKLRHLSHSSVNAQQQQPSSTPPPSSSGSNGFKILAFTLTGFSLGLGYVYLNPDSRHKFSVSVPQADALFTSIDAMLGRKAPEGNKLPPVKSTDTQSPPPNLFETKKAETVEKTSKPEPAKQQKVVKTEPKKVEAETKEVALPVKSEPVVEKVVEPVVQASVESKVEEPAPVKTPDWRETLSKVELQEEATIQAFETKLNNMEKAFKQNVNDSVNAAELAIQSLNNYSQSLRDALDESKSDTSKKETQWLNVTELFEKQSQFVNEAKQKISIGAKSLEEFENISKEARNNDMFKNLKAFRDGQRAAIEQQRVLKTEEAKLKEALIHANVLRSYTNEQKMARAQFLKEIQALQPEGLQTKRGANAELTTEEINNLLIHAHKRVLQLQNQVEKLQMTQSQQIQAALEDQQKQYDLLQKQNETYLRQICEQEFRLEKDKLLEAEKLKTNEAISKELASQAAAHNNHLAQMLRMQHNELATFYEKKLTAEREQIRNDFFTKVAATIGKVTGIENALQRRVNLELQANNASQLWLAVQNLNEIIATSTADTSDEVAHIKENIDTIKVSAPENEFVQKLVKSLPEQALEKGVWTEPDLKERFSRVKKVCNKVALIDERGGSLIKYFLSYVQSFFIVNTTIDHDKLDSVDGTPRLDELDLSTFNILNLAEHYVENGQIDLAIKLMRQLKGEPSRLAKDWVNDATVLLEIKQACHLLTSYISSIYIGTHLK